MAQAAETHKGTCTPQSEGEKRSRREAGAQGPRAESKDSLIKFKIDVFTLEPFQILSK